MDELPANVKAVLPWEAQEIFLKAFNIAQSKGLKESGCFSYAWRMVRNQGYRKNRTGNWALVRYASAGGRV